MFSSRFSLFHCRRISTISTISRNLHRNYTANAAIDTSAADIRNRTSIMNKHGRTQMEQHWKMLSEGTDWKGMQHTLKDIEHQLKDENVWTDTDRMTELSKRQETISQRLGEFQNVKNELISCLDLLELADIEDDNVLLEDSLADLDTLAPKLAEMAVKSLMSAEVDEGNCFINIHAGAGGTESCDWVSILSEMYINWAKSKKFKVSISDFNKHEQAGYKYVTLEILGSYAHGWLRKEEGTHRLVRVSPFDANKRRHTSFASVTVSPIITDKMLERNDIELHAWDLKTETFRAGGKGGQHQNKTDSAVRITHIPSGIVAKSTQERSQHENKRIALQMLKSKLYAIKMSEQQQVKSDRYASLGKNEWGGTQIRSYVLFPYQLIKDNRTQMQSSQVDKVLGGDLDEFLIASLLLQNN